VWCPRELTPVAREVSCKSHPPPILSDYRCCSRSITIVVFISGPSCLRPDVRDGPCVYYVAVCVLLY
jgi:hypothetical protein